MGVTSSPGEAKAIKSQLAAIIRPMYSNPPRHGAGIVEKILTSEDLYKQWTGEITLMANRIKEARLALFNAFKELGTPGTWNHILDQIGMFSFTGLSAAQMEYCIDKYSVYGLSSGRISMAGVTTQN